jgi:inosine-uridine nucleoside N-ribohydrolase
MTIPKILLDTDMDSDCDDAGTLAVAATLHREGVAELAGVLCSIPEPACAWYTRAVLERYGLVVPVGSLRLPEWETADRYAGYRTHRERAKANGTVYNEIIGGEWHAANPDAAIPDAVALYRRLLAAAEDGSITICAIGTLTALARVLDSPPDDVSPLDGRSLVAAKVTALATMAEGWFPEGADVFNWKMDLQASARVLRDWPGTVVVSPWGRQVCVGERFLAEAPDDHPVARAYRIHLGTRATNRPCWDQLAYLIAALGEDAPFAQHAGNQMTFDEATGRHRWQTGGGLFIHVEPTETNEELARRVEDLMIASL